jgi:hypothetical protein
MINVLSILPTYITPLFSKFLNNAGYDIAESLLSSAVYVISFIVPALLIRGILKKKDLLQPMRLTSGKFDAKALLLVPIAIAVIRAAATLNSKMLDIFGVSEVYSELVGLTTESYALYEIILLFISPHNTHNLKTYAQNLSIMYHSVTRNQKNDSEHRLNIMQNWCRRTENGDQIGRQICLYTVAKQL